MPVLVAQVRVVLVVLGPQRRPQGSADPVVPDQLLEALADQVQGAADLLARRLPRALADLPVVDLPQAALAVLVDQVQVVVDLPARRLPQALVDLPAADLLQAALAALVAADLPVQRLLPASADLPVADLLQAALADLLARRLLLASAGLRVAGLVQVDQVALVADLRDRPPHQGQADLLAAVSAEHLMLLQLVVVVRSRPRTD